MPRARKASSAPPTESAWSLQEATCGMSIEKILLEEAAYIAGYAKGTTPTLEAELRQIERREMEIEARLDAAQLARKRLLDYRLRIGADFLMSPILG